MATWPVQLPQTLRVQGYSQKMAANTHITNTDVGPPKIRKAQTYAPEVISGMQVLQSSDVTALRTFYNVTTLGGSTSFSWKHPMNSSSSALFWFLEPPQIMSVNNGKYEVAYSFLVSK